MIIKYTCPICGEDLQEIVLASDPPLHKQMCLYCGWESEGIREDVVRIPYNNDNLYSKNVVYLNDGWSIHAD